MPSPFLFRNAEIVFMKIKASPLQEILQPSSALAISLLAASGMCGLPGGPIVIV